MNTTLSISASSHFKSGLGIRTPQANLYSPAPKKPRSIAVVRPAAREIDTREANRIHRELRKICDCINWGVKRVDTETGEVSPQPHMKNATMDSWLETHRYHRQYTRTMNLAHLRGEETHYFYGGTHGDRMLVGFDQDGHNGETDGAEAMAFIQSMFVGLLPETSTHGDGRHGLFTVSAFIERYGHRRKLPARQLNKLVWDWHDRIGKAMKALGFQAPVEIKGAPCYTNESGKWVRGSLMRRPVTLTAEQIASLPHYTIEEVEATIQKIEAMAGLHQSAAKPATAETTGPVREAKKANDSNSCAFRRMKTARYDFCKRHGRLPTVDELLNWYEAMGLAHGELDDARRDRAENEIAHAQKHWVEKDGCEGGYDPFEYLEIVERRLGERELPENLTSEELAAVLANMTANAFNNEGKYAMTMPTRGAVESINSLHEQGILPRKWNRSRNAKAREILQQLKLVGGMHREKRPGMSRIYRLGCKHPRYQEHCELLGKLEGGIGDPSTPAVRAMREKMLAAKARRGPSGASKGAGAASARLAASGVSEGQERAKETPSAFSWETLGVQCGFAAGRWPLRVQSQVAFAVSSKDAFSVLPPPRPLSFYSLLVKTGDDEGGPRALPAALHDPPRGVSTGPP